MLRFEMDVSTTDLVSRTIEGTIVPFGEIGTIDGVRYRFRPGSIRLARTRTPLIVDHDRGNPVGVLAELVERDDGVLARFSVDTTPEGDRALIQAASGSRGSLSIGAEVDDEAPASGGVVDVLAARVYEVSLAALGAFDGAAVTRVAAQADEPTETPDLEETPDDDEEDTSPADPEATPDPDPNQTELPIDPDDDPDEKEARPMEATPDAPVIRAERQPSAKDLQAGELVRLMIQAQHGDRDATRYLEAVLAETISTDVTGLLPPTYERTVIGGKDVDRPLYTAFRSRPLPGVGLQVSKPKWTTPPSGAWAATVDADATSNKVQIGAQTADVARWDWAGAISWVVVQRSDPSIVDEIYSEAVQDFYLDVEAKIYAELGAAAPGVATSLGAAIAEFYTATGDQRSPELILMAPDVWGAFADAGALSQPVAAGGASAAGELTTSFAGIPATVSGTLAAGETILATRRAVDARVTEPVRLTANAIGALNVELAVVGEGLFDTDYPAELLKFAAIVPTIAPAGARSTRKSE
jgi:HK97 family phage prohead protease